MKLLKTCMLFTLMTASKLVTHAKMTPSANTSDPVDETLRFHKRPARPYRGPNREPYSEAYQPTYHKRGYQDRRGYPLPGPPDYPPPRGKGYNGKPNHAGKYAHLSEKYACFDELKIGSNGRFVCGIWANMYPEEVDNINLMFKQKDLIKRKVIITEDGIVAETYSDYPEMSIWIKNHVAQMQRMMKDRRMPLPHKEAAQAMYSAHSADSVHYEVKYDEKGVYLHQYGTTPCAVKLVQQHALGVNKFIEEGVGPAYDPEAAPKGCEAYNMQMEKPKETPYNEVNPDYIAHIGAPVGRGYYQDDYGGYDHDGSGFNKYDHGGRDYEEYDFDLEDYGGRGHGDYYYNYY